jgi:CRISPR-associated protein Cas1
VRAKIETQLRVAAAYAKNYLAETLGEAHRSLREALATIGAVSSLESLRGIEGSAARAYFDLLMRCNRSDLRFEGRKKHPPTDPVNALLSLGYALLTRELEGLLEAAGLDPTVGFYHQPDGDRPSLACDWVEEFRHAIVDRLVLALINRGTLTARDFQDPDTRQGVRLTPDGLRKMLSAYEKSMAGVDRQEGSASAGWRHVLLAQLAAILDALNSSEYRPHL